MSRRDKGAVAPWVVPVYRWDMKQSNLDSIYGKASWEGVQLGQVAD